MTSQMRKYLDLQGEKSEVTSRLLEIRLTPEPQLTPELRAEVTTLTEKQAVIEGEFRSALVAVQAEQESAVTVEDTEARELRMLAGRANVGDIFAAVTEHRQVADGPTKELQAHYGIGNHQVPLEMLRIDRGVEQRAASTVPSNIGDASQAEVAGPVFASGDGAFLGIERPTVAVGDAAFPILGTSPVVAGPFTNSSDAAQTTAVFTANSLAPERLQASYSYRRSDAARFAGLDSSLRMALNGGLSESLDAQAIAGSDGLLNGTNLSNHNVAAQTTFAGYINMLLYGRVDGRYARGPSDVRMLMGSGTFAHSSAQYKASETDEASSERLQSRSGGLMVSAHVPAASGNKQNALIRLGMDRGAAVQPMWEGISLVVDEVTRATQGEIVIHAILLSNFQITRAAQFYKQQTQHAA